MKKMDSYGLKLCKFQAELFQKSVNEIECSSRIFIRRFMLSNLAKRMDGEGFLFEAINLESALYEIEMQFGFSSYGSVKYGSNEIYWIGYIYRYWSYITGKSSKQIYKQVKPEELKKMYFPYHSLDPEQVIERIQESKQMTTEDEIKKGVEILKKIRNRK